MPESLLNFGLETALRDLCEFYSRPDLAMDFQAISIDKDLPVGIQINIYRIVQELISNAVKHARAKSIFVQCAQSQHQFHITIEDDGIGIAENDREKAKSMGLKNIQNRVEYLKGKMDIHTQHNEGTAINIELNINVT